MSENNETDQSQNSHNCGCTENDGQPVSIYQDPNASRSPSGLPTTKIRLKGIPTAGPSDGTMQQTTKITIYGAGRRPPDYSATTCSPQRTYQPRIDYGPNTRVESPRPRAYSPEPPRYPRAPSPCAQFSHDAHSAAVFPNDGPSDGIVTYSEAVEKTIVDPVDARNRRMHVERHVAQNPQGGVFSETMMGTCVVGGDPRSQSQSPRSRSPQPQPQPRARIQEGSPCRQAAPQSRLQAPQAPQPGSMLDYSRSRLQEIFATISASKSKLKDLGSKLQQAQQPEQAPQAVPQSRVQAPQSRLQAPQSRLQAPQSRLQAPQSRLQAPQSRLQPPQSRLQPPQSRLQPTQSRTQAPQSRLQPTQSRTQAPCSKPQAPRSRLQEPVSQSRPCSSVGSSRTRLREPPQPARKLPSPRYQKPAPRPREPISFRGALPSRLQQTASKTATSVSRLQEAAPCAQVPRAPSPRYQQTAPTLETSTQPCSPRRQPPPSPRLQETQPCAQPSPRYQQVPSPRLQEAQPCAQPSPRYQQVPSPRLQQTQMGSPRQQRPPSPGYQEARPCAQVPSPRYERAPSPRLQQTQLPPSPRLHEAAPCAQVPSPRYERAPSPRLQQLPPSPRLPEAAPCAQVPSPRYQETSRSMLEESYSPRYQQPPSPILQQPQSYTPRHPPSPRFQESQPCAQVFSPRQQQPLSPRLQQTIPGSPIQQQLPSPRSHSPQRYSPRQQMPSPRLPEPQPCARAPSPRYQQPPSSLEESQITRQIPSPRAQQSRSPKIPLPSSSLPTSRSRLPEPKSFRSKLQPPQSKLKPPTTCRSPRDEVSKITSTGAIPKEKSIKVPLLEKKDSSAGDVDLLDTSYIPTCSAAATIDEIKKLIEEEKKDVIQSQSLSPELASRLKHLKKKSLLEETLLETSLNVEAMEGAAAPGSPHANSDVVASLMECEERGTTKTPSSPKKSPEPEQPKERSVRVSPVALATTLNDIVVPVGDAPPDDLAVVNAEMEEQVADSDQEIPKADAYSESLQQQSSSAQEEHHEEAGHGTPKRRSKGELEKEKPPWEIATDLGSLEDLVAGQLSITEQLPSDESIRATLQRFEYILDAERPKHYSCVQLRGTQRPPWFPGYYFVHPECPRQHENQENYVLLEQDPSKVFAQAWNIFKPDNLRPNSEVVIL